MTRLIKASQLFRRPDTQPASQDTSVHSQMRKRGGVYLTRQ
eukprot:COSAG04_NODE_27225_length_285_cov_1.059140_1_plen_40_part_01